MCWLYWQFLPLEYYLLKIFSNILTTFFFFKMWHKTLISSQSETLCEIPQSWAGFCFAVQCTMGQSLTQFYVWDFSSEYWKITNIMISDQIKIIWSKSDLRSDQIWFCESDLIWSDLIWSVIFRSFSDHF